MFGESLKVADKMIISTGNVLSLNDLTKKPGQNTTQELVDAINITVKEYLTASGQPPEANSTVVVSRPNDDFLTKINEYDPSELKTGLKIFLGKDSVQFISEALEKAFTKLNFASFDDVIIAFKQREDLKDDFNEIVKVWKILEGYVKKGQIKQIGIADVEESTFRELFEWAEIKPSIIQINLSTCCVVPQTLQVFCKENDVKLLTHSDPTDILPAESIESIFRKTLQLKWAFRFLVHIKCRGVLATKGYLLSLDSK